jgi:uncharacterized protein YbjT (DUF2867 family)
MTILITGGTGRLGRHVADTLRSRSLDHLILSRTPGEGRVVADLDTGAGLAAALDGVGTVVHLATSRSKDIEQTRRLLDTMTLASPPAHLIFVSIVGVDRIPFPYYRDKVASEQAIEASDVPFTIIRVTQFHGFVTEALDAQRHLPVTLGLPVSAQTIHLPEVAQRLADLAAAGPSGRVADLGGPEQLTFREYVELWQKKRGIRRPIWMLHVPGRTVAAFRAGHHMPGLPGAGRVTYREYLEAGE